MPSTMIHLAVAHEIEPEGPGLFWVGNFAPDYTNDRALKDHIHLRDAADRWAALAKLNSELDPANPFERGWLMHLFTDACWDEHFISDFRDWYLASHADENWFQAYREEIGLDTYYLYHREPWAKEVWRRIERADLDEVATTLPIAPAENRWYRDRVAERHASSDPASAPRFFTLDMLEGFRQTTAERYRKWREALEAAT